MVFLNPASEKMESGNGFLRVIIPARESILDTLFVRCQGNSEMYLDGIARQYDILMRFRQLSAYQGSTFPLAVGPAPVQLLKVLKFLFPLFGIKLEKRPSSTSERLQYNTMRMDKICSHFAGGQFALSDTFPLVDMYRNCLPEVLLLHCKLH